MVYSTSPWAIPLRRMPFANDPGHAVALERQHPSQTPRTRRRSISRSIRSISPSATESIDEKSLPRVCEDLSFEFARGWDPDLSGGRDPAASILCPSRRCGDQETEYQHQNRFHRLSSLNGLSRHCLGMSKCLRPARPRYNRKAQVALIARSFAPILETEDRKPSRAGLCLPLAQNCQRFVPSGQAQGHHEYYGS